MIRAVAGGFAFGVMLTIGVSFPPEIWPLFGFIVLVYGLLAAWELRVLLRRSGLSVRQANAGAAEARPALPGAQTRSSTA